MLRVRPFEAIRPHPTNVARVASPPYDVVNEDEARALAAENPQSFLRVVRSEIDLPPDTSPYDDAVYETARRNLDRMLETNVMMREDEPRMYIYRQVRNHRRQAGLVCCCHIDDYANGTIKKHEKTRRDKEDDRTRHVLATDANSGPVFLTYRKDLAVQRFMIDDMNHRPLFHFDADDGVTHTVWTVVDPGRYVDAFSNVPAAYVADGHHRTASAARAGAERRAANPDHTGNEPYNWFLTVLFPAEDLTILAYNRVIRTLGDRTADEVRDALAAVGTLTASPDGGFEPERAGIFAVYLDGGWYRLELDPATIDAADPIASLDVDLLQRRIMEPVFGIGDPRTDTRLAFVGGSRGLDELERLVDSGEGAVAIAMHPTSIEQLLDVSDAGLIMPPKSTWFEPKLRSGLFVYRLDESPVMK